MNLVSMMGKDPFDVASHSLNFEGVQSKSLSFGGLSFGGLSFDNEINTSLTFDFKSDISLDFEKLGGFELALITEFEPECLSMFSTEAPGRSAKRRKVVHCGQVPQVGQRALMYKKSYNDMPVSVGVSAWMV